MLAASRALDAPVYTAARSPRSLLHTAWVCPRHWTPADSTSGSGSIAGCDGPGSGSAPLVRERTSSAWTARIPITGQGKQYNGKSALLLGTDVLGVQRLQLHSRNFARKIVVNPVHPEGLAGILMTWWRGY